METLHELALSWYSLIGSLGAELSLPLRDLAVAVNSPLASAILFGLIGSTSPCQLTTNASAAAYLARDAGRTRRLTTQAAAFVVGKVLVYTALGLVVSAAGGQLSQASIPVAVLARKALGPVMLLLGLRLLRLLPLRFALGSHLSAWLETVARRNRAGAFLLGTAFALAFCPTLFLLFFGLTIPMMPSSPLVGVFYPAAFALGTVLPLLGVLGLIGLGFGTAGTVSQRLQRLSAYVPVVAGLVFLLAGANDTLVYWLL